MPWWMIALSVAAAIAAVAVWWWVPKWQAGKLRRTIRDAKARADVEDNFRKTLSQLIGGAAVLLTAALAYYQTQQSRLEADKQTQQTVHEAQLSREAADRQSERSVAAARALALSQQVSKGFEDLGSNSPMIVLGGIYALEGVMQAPDLQYHRAVLEALCAFVRDRTHGRKPPTDITKKIAPAEPPPVEIRAALTVIGRRPPDLVHAADLTGLRLWGISLTGANLSGANLLHANFSGAYLTFAYLSAADLSDADLTNTNLAGADLTEPPT